MNVFVKREQRKLACSAERRKGRMKSKIFFFCALVGAIGFAGAKTYERSQKNVSKDLLLQNVEALSESENLEKYHICYYESVVKKGRTYYDCGSCKKVYDEKGKGTYSKCFY